MMGVGGDAEAVVSAEADEPEDGARGIGDDQLTAFLKDRELAVGEEITHQFMAFHAKRLEDVTRLYGTQSEREMNGVGIEGGDGWITTDAYLYPNLFYSNLSGFIDAVCAGLRNDERFDRGSDGL